MAHNVGFISRSDLCCFRSHRVPLSVRQSREGTADGVKIRIRPQFQNTAAKASHRRRPWKLRATAGKNRPHRPAVRKADGLSARGERGQPDGVAVPVRLRAGDGGLDQSSAQRAHRRLRLPRRRAGERLAGPDLRGRAPARRCWRLRPCGGSTSAASPARIGGPYDLLQGQAGYVLFEDAVKARKRGIL